MPFPKNIPFPEISTLNAHYSTVESVALHSSLPFLATGSMDQTVRLWRVNPDGSADKTPLAILEGHSDMVTSVAFHPTLPLLASGSYDNTVKLWRVYQDGTVDDNPIATLTGHRDKVNSVAFHQTLPLLATCSNDWAPMLWRVTPDGSVDMTPAATLWGHDYGLTSVAFHPTLPLLATGSRDNTVKLWRFEPDGSAATCAATLRGHIFYVASLAFHPRLPLLATGSHDYTAKLWHLNPDGSGATCAATLRGHRFWVNSVAFHPTLPVLATGSLDETAKLWHINPDSSADKINPDGSLEKTPIATLNGHSSNVKSVAFDPKGNFLVTGSYDETVKVWNCSKIDEYLRREAITRAGLATHLLKGLTTEDSEQQLRFSNSAQGRLGNPPDMPYSLENMARRDEILRKKYVGLLSRNPISSKPNAEFTQCDRCKADDAAAAAQAATDPEFMKVFQQRSKSHCMDCPREANRPDTDKMPGGRRSRRKLNKRLSRYIRNKV